jgi:hypothetical protein
MTSGVPGRGALPFLVGFILIILSVMVLILAMMKARGQGMRVAEEKFFLEEDSWKRVVLAIALLVLYGVFVTKLGYPVTTFLFLIFVLKVIEPQPWRKALIFSFLATTASYAIFKALEVNLPTGYWGF